MQVISEDEPTPLSSIKSVFRGDLNTIVLKAMEKDKNQRYQSAADLAADIDRYLTDQPIQARLAGAMYQLRKFARRNQALVGGIAATLLALILGLVGTTWWAMAARQARLQAEQSEFLTTEKAAQLAIQRAPGKTPLGYIDKALASDVGKDSISLRLDRIRSLFALNDTAGAVRDLEMLSRRTDLGEHEGAVLLMEADVLQGDDIEGTIAKVKRARDKGLSPADDAYAESLIAESTPEAVKALRTSLSRNAYQPRAQGMLCLLLLLLGQREEAGLQLRTYAALFPEDLNLKLMQALLAATMGDGRGAEGQLAAVQAQLDEATRQDLKTIVSVLAEACDTKNWVNGEFTPILGHHLEAIAKIDRQRWRSGNQPAGQFLLPMPPPLQRTLGRLRGIITVFAKKDDLELNPAIAELEAIHSIHPEGTTRYIQAMIHVSGGRWIEAEKAAMVAADEPALLPIHRQALWVAGVAQGYLGTPRRKDPDLQMRQKAGKSLKRAFAIIPVQPHEREFAAKILIYAGETNLASRLLDDWAASDPENKHLPWLRARAKFHDGAYQAAIEEAQKVLKLNPKDTETEELLKEATKKLLDAAKKVQPPSGAMFTPSRSLRRPDAPILPSTSCAPVHPPMLDRFPTENLVAAWRRHAG